MKKLIVVPYFGHLPNYFQLWLLSCGKNPTFNWIFLSDCDLSDCTIPANVQVIETNLVEIKEILQSAINRKIALSSPYKLCDYRPLFWALLDYYKLEYDFWGYCDIDVIFGRLSEFLTDKLLADHDRVYSLGHLSLLSSSPISKYAFMLHGSETPWTEVFSNDKNYGFDEHHGINKIWRKQNLLFYEKENDILDLDPQFKGLRLTNTPLNKRRQLFIYEGGRILQGYWQNKKLIFREFAYIHFQKRTMKIPNDIVKYNRIQILDNELRPLVHLSEKNENIWKQNMQNSAEPLKKLRSSLRFYKNHFFKMLL